METLLVTAFFDIGRGESNIKNLKRSSQKYFDYFKHWARIQNILVVYTQPEFVNDVMKIREAFGLKEKTIIITIEDLATIEPQIYRRMIEVEERGDWSYLRLHIAALSNQAMYDYIMLIKYWCMANAVTHLSFNGNVAWIDFGFDHGGKCYTDSNDFNFLWQPNIEVGIHFFANTDIDNSSMGVLLLQSDCIMGCLVLAHSSKCQQLWEYCKDAMKALLMLDAIDDDQQLLLMAYRAHPDDIFIHHSNWFLPLKELGGKQLKVRPNYGIEKNVMLFTSVKNFVAKLIYAMLRDYSHASPYDFGKRMKNYAKKYR